MYHCGFIWSYYPDEKLMFFSWNCVLVFDVFNLWNVVWKLIKLLGSTLIINLEDGWLLLWSELLEKKSYKIYNCHVEGLPTSIKPKAELYLKMYKSRYLVCSKLTTQKKN